MAEEKIFEEELLDDTELEDVAGGTHIETIYDARALHDLGKFQFNSDHSFLASQMANALRNLGKELGIDITYNWTNRKDNEYGIDGEKVSRDEFWAIIKEAYAADKN